MVSVVPVEGYMRSRHACVGCGTNWWGQGPHRSSIFVKCRPRRRRRVDVGERRAYEWIPDGVGEALDKVHRRCIPRPQARTELNWGKVGSNGQISKTARSIMRKNRGIACKPLRKTELVVLYVSMAFGARARGGGGILRRQHGALRRPFTQPEEVVVFFDERTRITQRSTKGETDSYICVPHPCSHLLR